MCIRTTWKPTSGKVGPKPVEAKKRLSAQARHLIATQRHADHVAALHEEHINAAYDAAVAVVRRADLGAITEQQRAETVINAVAMAYRQRYATARARLQAALREYVDEEAAFQSRVHEVPVIGEVLWSSLGGELVNGQTLDELVSNFEVDVLREIKRTLRAGWIDGEDTEALAGRLE